MPWTTSKPPKVALNWTDAQKKRCVSAANSALEDGKTEEEAIQACIGAAGKGKDKSGGFTMRFYTEIDGKAVSLDDMVSDIKQQFYAKHPSYPEPQEWHELWIPQGGVFEDHVIVREGDKAFQVDFTADGEGGEIAFADRDDWIEVEMVWQPKSADGASAAVDDTVKTAGDEPVADNSADVSGEGTDADDAAKGSLSKSADAEPMDDNCDVVPGRPVKALGEHRIGEYLVLWGGPDQRDLAEEYFTGKTAELTTVFDAVGKIPILYQHAMDNKIKSSVVGTIDILKPDEVGLWAEGEMMRAHEYRTQIAKLIDNGVLHWSSGTLPGARSVASDGHIERWAIVEASLTPTPMEFRMVERPVAAVKAAYVEVGLEFPAQPDDGEGAEEARQNIVEAERERIRLLNL